MLRAVVAVCALLLAGCSGSPSPEPVPDDFEGIAIDGEGGTIRGVVVDTAIVPLEGVNVSLEGGAIQRTNDKGAFVFAGLEPGLYVLHISREGYFDMTVTAPVARDGPSPTLKVVLDPDISETAYVQAVRVEGFLECGIGIPGAGSWSVCQAPVGVLEILCKGSGPVPPPNVCLPPVSQHEGVLEVPVDRVPTFAQAEAVWDPTSAGAEVLTWSAYVREPGTTQFSNGTSVTGPSPVVMPWSQQNLTAWDVGGKKIMVYQVFPESGGIGNLVLQQQVELFVTTFYRFQPAPGWQFTIDGEPTPP